MHALVLVIEFKRNASDCSMGLDLFCVKRRQEWIRNDKS